MVREEISIHPSKLFIHTSYSHRNIYACVHHSCSYRSKSRSRLQASARREHLRNTRSQRGGTCESEEVGKRQKNDWARNKVCYLPTARGPLDANSLHTANVAPRRMNRTTHKRKAATAPLQPTQRQAEMHQQTTKTHKQKRLTFNSSL